MQLYHLFLGYWKKKIIIIFKDVGTQVISGVNCNNNIFNTKIPTGSPRNVWSCYFYNIQAVLLHIYIKYGQIKWT